MMLCAGIAVGALGLANDHASARQALADIIVAVAGQLQRDAVREERAEALAGGALQPDEDAVLRQAFVAEAARDLARQHRADAAVHVARLRARCTTGLPLFSAGSAAAIRSRSKHVGETVILPLRIAAGDLVRGPAARKAGG